MNGKMGTGTFEQIRQARLELERLKSSLGAIDLSREHEFILGIFEAICLSSDRDELISMFLARVSSFTGCREVWLRLKELSPYRFYLDPGNNLLKRRFEICERGPLGFSHNEMESNCPCTWLMKGPPVKRRKGGHNAFLAMYSSQLEEFMRGNALYEKGLCPMSGLETAAIVPLGAGSTTAGLLYIGDPEPEAIGRGQVDILEEAGRAVGHALLGHDWISSLAEDRERLSVTLRSIGDGVITTDGEGRVQLLNKAAEELTGWTSEEARGVPVSRVFDIYDEETREGVSDPVSKVLKEGRVVYLSNHTRLRTRTGEERSIADSGAPILDDRGEIRGAVLVFRDVSGEREARMALEKSESRYRSLFEDSPVALREEDFSSIKKLIDTLKEEGVSDFRTYFEDHPEEVERCASFLKILDANRATLDLYGAANKDELLSSWRPVFSESSHLSFIEELVKVSEGELEYKGEDQTLTFAGDLRDITLQWTVLPGHEADMDRVLVSISDITELKRNQRELARREEELSTILESAPVLIIVVDSDRRIRKASGMAEKLLGVPPEELKGLRGGEAMRCIHRLDSPEGCGFGEYCQSCSIRNAVIDTIETGKSHDRVEGELPVDAGGEIVNKTFMVSTNRLVMSGESLALVCIEDITDRKLIEKELARSSEWTERVLDSISDGFFVLDHDLKVTYFNRAAEKVLGKKADEVLGKRLFDAFIEARGSDFEYVYSMAVKEGIAATFETCFEPWGEWFEVRVYPHEDGISVFFQVTTERKREHQALLASEEKYRTLFESAGDAIFIHDLEGNFIEVNKQAAKRLGYTREELLRMGPRHIDSERFADLLPERIETLAKNGQLSCETAHMRKDGVEIPVELSSRIINYKGSQAVLTVARDIRERKEAEAERNRLLELYESTLSGLPLSLLVVDRDLEAVIANQRFMDNFSREWSGEEGKPISGIIDPDFLEANKIAEMAKNTSLDGQPREIRETVYHGGGEGERVINLYVKRLGGSGEELRIMLAFEDITEQVRLKEQLLQSQKMEAIGRLAGGVAHDFNNLMTAVMGNCEIAMAIMGESGPSSLELSEIKKAAERASALTRQLLAFSRKQVMKTVYMDLNESVKNMERMLRRLIGEDVKLLTSLGPDLGKIKADPTQIEQVIINLAVNARDAMPTGGMLGIATYRQTLGEDFCRTRAGIQPGEYVVLKISDTGEGIDPEILPHVFEPFFTTKDVSRGTGLGLATAYGIITQSGGCVEIDSWPAKGTVFSIYFPLAGDTATVDDNSDTPAVDLSGSETVLVVEDDRAVRELVVRVLRNRGYKILTASSGEEALRLAKSYADPVHLLLTDIVMPGMNGKELSENLIGLKGDMPVIYMSGYTKNVIARHGVLDPGVVLIEKPFHPDELLDTVRRELNKKQ